MFAEIAPVLEGWTDFYLIVGTAAGALTGVMFIVITLRADGGRARSIETFETFATPTIVELTTVLLISALATVPQHSETISAPACWPAAL